MTSRPSDPGVVKLLPPDWESHWFAAQLAALHLNTCENWVDINGIPIQEEERLTSSWEDVLCSEEEPDLKTVVLEIQTSLLRVGFTGILKLGKGYW